MIWAGKNKEKQTIVNTKNQKTSIPRLMKKEIEGDSDTMSKNTIVKVIFWSFITSNSVCVYIF